MRRSLSPPPPRRTRAVARAAAACALLAAIPGCQRREAGAGAAAKESKNAGEPETPEPAGSRAADVRPPTVELLAAGAEPRRELRYRFEPGTEERVTLRLDMKVSVKVGGREPPPVRLPGMELALELATEKAAGAGAVRYRFAIAGAKVRGGGAQPMAVSALETGLSDLVGTEGTGVLDARGFNRDSEIELPRELRDKAHQMLQSAASQLEQMASPLPSEPVGPGAKWKVIQHRDQGGVAVVQTTVYTLHAIDGDAGRMTAEIAQTAEPQDFLAPGLLPPGASAELVSFAGEGAGEIGFDLSRLAPRTYEGDLTTDSAFEIEVGGSTKPMTLHLELEIELEGD